MIKIYRGDIVKMGVGAIVNAANPSLLGGGGVDGAIHLAAGPQLQEYCRKLKGCAVGQAKISPGFNLAAKHIIHTVGPIWQGGYADEASKLANCYKNCLKLAAEYKIKEIAFPAISCGIYGYPPRQAAEIAYNCVKNYMCKNNMDIIVYFVAFDSTMEGVYRQIIPIDN